MALKIYSSSELMTNYMQVNIIAPDKRFEAIQTTDGKSLLFSIGTDGVFYLTEETTSVNNGWNRRDLSSDLLAQYLPNDVLIAKTFAISQYLETGVFTVGLVITVAGIDYLYLASVNIADDWQNTGLVWELIGFDLPSDQNNPLDISDIYILQMNNVPLIVVNVVPPGSETLVRYYIDSQKVYSTTFWNQYTLPFNMDAKSAQLCGGRKAGDEVSGIYSLGSIGGVSSVFYQEIFNPFEHSMAGATSQLDVPTGTPLLLASVLSAVQSNDEAFETDLYVVTEEGCLYLFTADNQKNGAYGLRILQNSLFGDVEQLYVFNIADKVVVWGRNRAQQIFYTACAVNSVTDANAWSCPMPIATNVEQIAPYTNMANGENTIFVNIGNNQLKKAMQDTVSNCWITQDITLATDTKAKASSTNCYMSRFTVSDSNNNPQTNLNLLINSSYRVPVYINNEYYILDKEPIQVTTDAQGALKIVQRIDNLQAAIITITSTDSVSTATLNPMDGIVNKLNALTDPPTLSKAQILDDNGNLLKPLVPANLSQDDISYASASIESLISAYQSKAGNAVTDTPVTALTGSLVKSQGSGKAHLYTTYYKNGRVSLNVINNVEHGVSDVANAITVAAGDLCGWLRNAADYVIQIVEDTGQEVWHFVATIAGNLYTFIIETVEQAIAALEALFSALGTLISDLIQFVKFLFDWDDIKQTNSVMLNMLNLYLEGCVSTIPKIKSGIDKSIAALIQDVNDWTGGLGNDAAFAQQPLTYAQSQTDYSTFYSSPNAYLQDHFVNNVPNAYALSPGGGINPSLSDLVKSLLATLENAVEAEKENLNNAFTTISDKLLKNEQYASMSLVEILSVLLDVVGNTILSTIDDVFDALLNLLDEALTDLLATLNEPIWIPVVSDILAAAFGYKINFSILEILCMVGAIPATLLYKAMHNAAPFSLNDGFSTKLMQANSYSQLQTDFGDSGPIDYSKSFYSMFGLSDTEKNIIFEIGHSVSTFFSFVETALLVAQAATENSKVANARTAANLIKGISFSVTGLFAAPYPIQNQVVSNLSTGISAISVSTSVVFFGLTSLLKGDAGKTVVVLGAALDSLLSLTAIAPSAYHFYELSGISGNAFRTLSILNETANLTGYLGAITSDIGIIDYEPESKVTIIVISSLITLIYGLVQGAEVIVDGV